MFYPGSAEGALIRADRFDRHGQTILEGRLRIEHNGEPPGISFRPTGQLVGPTRRGNGGIGVTGRPTIANRSNRFRALKWGGNKDAEARVRRKLTHWPIRTDGNRFSRIERNSTNIGFPVCSCRAMMPVGHLSSVVSMVTRPFNVNRILGPSAKIS